MKPSIANRISRAQFFTIGIFIIVFAASSYLFTRFVEQKILSQDFEEERSFFLEEHGHEDYFRHNTKSVFIEYIPTNSNISLSPESIFQGITGNTQAQLFQNNTYYWVASKQTSHGTFYHARDLTSLKAREQQYLLIDAIAVSYTHLTLPTIYSV